VILKNIQKIGILRHPLTGSFWEKFVFLEWIATFSWWIISKPKNTANAYQRKASTF
jgi:hypothetical protein